MENLREGLEAVVGELNLLTQKVKALIRNLESKEKLDAKSKKAARQKAAPSSEKSPKKAGHSKTDKAASPNRQKIIRMINSMRKKGVSYDQIAQHLESKGIPTFSGRGKWRKQTVHKLFQRHI